MSQKRLYFLDNLKWAIIYLMVVFHAAMCYMAYAPEWWYVVDKAQPVFCATLFISWADIFIMPVMFFISGYFGLMSLARHGARQFWAKKFGRIFLPWVFGAMVIAPFVTYLILASRHAPMDFWTFYTTLFWGPLYEQAAYWYLGALLALYVLLYLAVKICPALLSRTAVPEQPGRLFYPVLFAVAIVSIGCITARLHPDTWMPFAYILMLQPVRIPTYIAVFFAGAWAYRTHWFEAGGYTPSAPGWGLAFFLFGLVYLWQKFALPTAGASPDTLRWANACTQGAFTMGALFGLLGIFRRVMDHTTPRLSALSRTSYGVYYVHMPILFPVAWAFLGVSLNVYLKYAIVCAITLALCYLLARYVLLRMPCFGGGRK